MTDKNSFSEQTGYSGHFFSLYTSLRLRRTTPQVPSPNMHNAGYQCTVSVEIHAKQLDIMVPLETCGDSYIAQDDSSSIVARFESSRSTSSGFMEAKDAATRVNCKMGKVASSLWQERIAKVFAQVQIHR
jgi:hypothetical protein